jgi:type IV fimbrial biogenesis protein FimT
MQTDREDVKSGETMSNAYAARQAGFNVLELMITLMVAGVVLGVGVPSFTQFLANNRMAAAANDLISSIHTARTEAVKRRQTVTVCASSDWANASPTCNLAGAGWIVFFDADGDVNVDAGDTIITTHGPVPDRITFAIDAASVRYLQFGGNGFPRTAAAGTPISNIRLCDYRGNANTGGGVAAGRWIAIGVTGRPQLYRTQAQVQANPIGGC